LLIYVNLPVSHAKIWHPYLREAKTLRPDWVYPSPSCLAHQR
jgi:chorismate mutase